MMWLCRFAVWLVRVARAEDMYVRARQESENLLTDH